MANRSVMRLQWRSHKLMWRLSGGRLGNRVVGMPVLELVTIGHKSGKQRSILITYLDEPGGPIVFATNAGLDRDPAWVTNLRACDVVRVRIAGEWTDRRATEPTDEGERQRLWRAAVAANPDYARYLAMLTRSVPIVQLRSPTSF
jgi:F420H(2)-dependent quinone reductase